MSNVGPVCHIPPANTPGDPQPHDIPGIPGPANPNDPVSIANLLNAMRLAMLALLNELKRNNNTQDQGFNRRPDPNHNDKKTQWVEVNRVTNKVRVFQNNDPTSHNWVDVEQINQLTMHDRKTGNLWKWDRNRK